MTRVRRFLGLPAPQQRLLAEACFLVALAHVAVRVLSFATLRRLARRAARPARGRRAADPAAVRRAVETAGRVLPRSTCLMTGLAAHVLLARGGCPSRLWIGVAPSPSLRAHAWVESRNQVIVGGTQKGGVLRSATAIEAVDGTSF